MKQIKQVQIIQTLLTLSAIHHHFPQRYHSQLRFLRYAAGETICHQGEELTALHLVIEGKVKIVRKLFNGKEYILDITSCPNLIGDIELLTGQAIVSSVVALEEVLVAQLPLDDRQTLLEDAHFLHKIGKGLATSLYHQNIQAASNIGYSVKERLATHILSIEKDGVFQLELQLLADSFGTSYRHLLRTVKFFLEQGVIRKIEKDYQIQEIAALEKLRIHP